ncbi:hypothetical protein NFI96_000502 [Prochilodus magdalenae]|nr:hypothetical protein NFI96_000502 [Prochilodus magdalenae]
MLTALLILTVCLFTGQGDESGVFQAPDIIWGSTGSSVEMNCSHKKDIRHRQMYWFKQAPGEGMTPIAFTFVGGEPDYGDHSKDKYEAVKTDVESGSLSVKNLGSGDAALYFCAVSKGDESGVFQAPDIIWGSAGSSVEMNCSHEKDISHRQMYWFKQAPGEGMTPIAFTFVGGEPDYGDLSKDKYEAVKTDVENGSLRVKNLGSGDAALYFCAVSYTICKNVDQSPADVLCLPKTTVKLTCQHKISNYDTVLWYQRVHGDTNLKLIAYASYENIKQIEPEYKGHFNVTGNGEKSVTLHVLQARQVEDSAMYFCAAYIRHSAAHFLSQEQKPTSNQVIHLLVWHTC